MFTPPSPYDYPDVHIRHVHEHNALHFDHYQKSTLKTGKKGESTRTLSPYVTGTSVLAIKYKDGVMIAADTLASYGSLARFNVVPRVCTLGKHTLVGGSGDYSDFQYIMKTLEEKVNSDEIMDDGSHLSPKALQQYLSRLMYERRNKMDPLWGQIIVGGWDGGKSFLGLTDLHGSAYTEDLLATGYGSYIALPLLRRHHRVDMTHAEAKELLETCLRVLFYRDARASAKIQVATVTADGPSVSAPYDLATDWSPGVKYYGKDILNVTGYDNNNNNA